MTQTTKSKTVFELVCESIRKCRACQRKKWGLCISHKPLEPYLNNGRQR